MKQAENLIRLLKRKNLKLALAESCTGGELASQLTRIPGVSEQFVGSLVTYRESAKRSWLGVKASTLKRYSAVSAECSQEMCAGLLKITPEAQIGLAVTGYLGPGNEKDGLVFVTLGTRRKRITLRLEILPEARPSKALRLKRKALLVDRLLQELSRFMKSSPSL